METTQEKKSLKRGSHLFKFVSGDTVNVKLYFPKYTMVKVEVFEYDIDNNYELKPLIDE